MLVQNTYLGLVPPATHGGCSRARNIDAHLGSEMARQGMQCNPCRTTTLINDHPPLYDQILCDAAFSVCAVLDRRPSPKRDQRPSLLNYYQSWTTAEWMSDRGKHVLHIIPIGCRTQTNTVRIPCKSGSCNFCPGNVEKFWNWTKAEVRIEL